MRGKHCSSFNIADLMPSLTSIPVPFGLIFIPYAPLNLRIIIGKFYPEDSFSQRAKISPSKMFQNQRHNKTGHKTQLTSSCKSFPVVIDFLGIKAKLRVRALVAHTVLNTQRCLNSYQGSIRWQHLSRMKVSR